jgi:S1-C subfamily serine protease
MLSFGMNRTHPLRLASTLAQPTVPRPRPLLSYKRVTSFCRSLFSCTYGLFSLDEKTKSFPFNRLRTLLQNTRGGGYLASKSFISISFPRACFLLSALLLAVLASAPAMDLPPDEASLFASVCPVVYQLDESSAKRGFHYIFYGNAFFINDQGHLLTAAHVLSEFSNGGQPQILLRLPEAPPRLVEVTVIAKDLVHDVAILQATPNPFHTRYQVAFLALSSQKAEIGDPVIAEALRPSRLKDPQTFDVPREDRSIGQVLQYLSTPLDKGQPNGELFLFSHEVQRGQSGAPVVSRDNHGVVGLVEGRWLHPASVPIAGSDGKPSLTQGAAIPISYATALLDQNHIPWQGDSAQVVGRR